MKIDDVEAASLELSQIVAEGSRATGVSVERSRFAGDIKISGVRAAGSDAAPKKN